MKVYEVAALGAKFYYSALYNARQKAKATMVDHKDYPVQITIHPDHTKLLEENNDRYLRLLNAAIWLYDVFETHMNEEGEGIYVDLQEELRRIGVIHEECDEE